MTGMWAFVVIAGPIILLAALVIAWALNRKTRVPMAVTEAATKRNREEEAADEHAHEHTHQKR